MCIGMCSWIFISKAKEWAKKMFYENLINNLSKIGAFETKQFHFFFGL